MKKLLVIFASLFVVFGLVACDEPEVEEKEVSSVETSDDENQAEEATDDETESESKEFNQVLVDNDNLKATLINIEKVVDTLFDEEYYEVNIEIENKRDDTIEVQAHEVSADGKMIDDMIFFSETVAGGKTSDATMTIQNYDGDLPPLEENLEFILNAFSFDDFEYEDKTDVLIEF